jgi:hypothetical protein
MPVEKALPCPVCENKEGLRLEDWYYGGGYSLHCAECYDGGCQDCDHRCGSIMADGNTIDSTIDNWNDEVSEYLYEQEENSVDG